MTQPVRMDAKTAHEELTEHPHYRYRGCASDPDDPRQAAGNPALSVDAWQGPDVDGGEEKEVREAREDAAREVCVECPVMVQCLAYGSSLTPEGKLAEPYAILGGMTALERHKALVEFLKERQDAPVRVEPAPVEQLRTVQKLAVLKALARMWDPFEVAAAAGVDVRTANWQRSSLVRLLGLPKDSSRMRALAVARERGLLEGLDVVADDGTVPAVPPPTKTTDQTAPAVPGPPSLPVQRAPEGLPRALRPRRRRVAAVRGQLPLFDEPAQAATVTVLYPSNRRLEAAA